MIGGGTPGLCGVLALRLAWGPAPPADGEAAPDEVAVQPGGEEAPAAGQDAPPTDGAGAEAAAPDADAGPADPDAGAGEPAGPSAQAGAAEGEPSGGAPPGDASGEGTDATANESTVPGASAESGDLATDTPADGESAPAAPEPYEPQFGTPGETSSDVGPAPRSMDDSGAPGGYWGPTDTKDLEPPDGRRRILIGSIVLPLGVIATVTGAVATYFTVPDHCVDRLGSIGVDAKQSRCKGLYALNIVRTTYGSLMIVTGAVFLALGVRDRKANREWHKHHSRRGGRRFAVTGGPGGLTLRF